jgi:hypothetical protein
MQSLVPLLLSCFKKKSTRAFHLITLNSSYTQVVSGVLYIQLGTPLSCDFKGLSGEESLCALYQEERSGNFISYKELDCLAIFSENISGVTFQEILLSLFEKFRLRKVTRSYFHKELETVTYWQ